MGYTCLSEYVDSGRSSVEDVVFILCYLLEQLEALHSAGGYHGNLSRSTLRYKPFFGLELGDPKVSATGSVFVKQSEEISLVGRLALELLTGRDTDGIAALDILVNPSQSLESFELPASTPVWLQLLIKRMLHAEINPLSARECREVIERNVYRSKDGIAPLAQRKLKAAPNWSLKQVTPIFDTSPEELNSDWRDLLLFGMALVLSLMGLFLLGPLSLKIFAIASPFTKLLIWLPLYFFVAFIQLAPFGIYLWYKEDLSTSLRRWGRAAVCLCVWMQLCYMGQVLYLRANEVKPEGVVSEKIATATWYTAAEVSLEMIAHSGVFAPIAGIYRLEEGLVGAVVKHKGNAANSMTLVYYWYLAGFLGVLLTFLEFSFFPDKAILGFFVVAGILAGEVLIVGLLEQLLWAHRDAYLQVAAGTFKVSLRPVSLVFGFLNIAAFWTFWAWKESLDSVPLRVRDTLDRI
jgi:hypothetical protein